MENETRGPGRPPKVQQPSETQALLAALIEQNRIQAEQNRLLIEQMGKNNIELAAELRKPTELEQKKLDDEKRALVKRAENAVRAAKEKDRVTQAKQGSCVHRDKNGITNFNGQVDSAGHWAIMCGKCYLIGPRIKATDDERLNGINLRSWENVTYEGLLQLHRQREGISSPLAVVQELAVV